ncbi:MAG: hypothetical protein AAF600_21565 [Bacteroidota bacterium]
MVVFPDIRMVLFKQAHLKGIKEGKVDLAFRTWKKPTVKEGSIINTSIGQVRVVFIKKVTKEDIAEADAKRAGFSNLDGLLSSLSRDGDTFRIKVTFHQEDPRIKLRNNDLLSDDDFNEIVNKLKRLDRYSKQGNWTLSVCKVIQLNPKLRAVDLAKITGREKEWLKTNIRKLKNLGLTISHEVGYSLSPRGKVFLERLEEKTIKSK